MNESLSTVRVKWADILIKGLSMLLNLLPSFLLMSENDARFLKKTKAGEKTSFI